MAKARNPNHMDNLKPFKKGFDERRNTKGVPRGIPEIKQLLDEVLNDEHPTNGKTALELIFIALRQKALKGDMRAIQEILDRTYGKAKQNVDITTNGSEINLPVINWTNGSKTE